MQGMAGPEPSGQGQRVGVEVVEVPVRDEQHIGSRLLLLGARALGIAEPGVDQHRPAARRDDLHAGVAQPGERGVATDRHVGTLLPPPGRPLACVSFGPLSAARRLHSRRGRRADRLEPRAHQLDGAVRPGGGHVLRGRAGEALDGGDPGVPRVHGVQRCRLRGPRLGVGHGSGPDRRRLARDRRSRIRPSPPGSPGAVRRARPRHRPGDREGRTGHAAAGRRARHGRRGPRAGRADLGRRPRRRHPARDPAAGARSGDRRRVRRDDPGSLVPRHAQAARGAARVVPDACTGSWGSRSCCSWCGSASAWARPGPARAAAMRRRRADRALGAVRVAAPDRGAPVPLDRLLGGDPDGTIALDGVATGLLYINVGTIASGTILAAGLYFGAGLLV